MLEISSITSTPGGRAEGVLPPGIDLTIPTAPVVIDNLKAIKVRIIGQRNPITGDIADYHREVHGTTYLVPLTRNQELSLNNI